MDPDLKPLTAIRPGDTPVIGWQATYSSPAQIQRVIREPTVLETFKPILPEIARETDGLGNTYLYVSMAGPSVAVWHPERRMP